MVHCWQEDPDDRPTFVELAERLEQLIESDVPYLSLDADTSAHPERHTDVWLFFGRFWAGIENSLNYCPLILKGRHFFQTFHYRNFHREQRYVECGLGPRMEHLAGRWSCTDDETELTLSGVEFRSLYHKRNRAAIQGGGLQSKVTLNFNSLRNNAAKSCGYFELLVWERFPFVADMKHVHEWNAIRQNGLRQHGFCNGKFKIELLTLPPPLGHNSGNAILQLKYILTSCAREWGLTFCTFPLAHVSHWAS